MPRNSENIQRVTMKKYMVLWGGAIFFVICFSLYLMIETSPGSNVRPVEAGEVRDVVILRWSGSV